MEDFSDPRKRSTRGRGRGRGGGRARARPQLRQPGRPARSSAPSQSQQHVDRLGSNADRYERFETEAEVEDADEFDSGLDFDTAASQPNSFVENSMDSLLDPSETLLVNAYSGPIAHFQQLDSVLAKLPLVALLGGFAAEVLGTTAEVELEKGGCGLEMFPDPVADVVLDGLEDLDIEEEEENEEEEIVVAREDRGVEGEEDEDGFDQWLDGM